MVSWLGLLRAQFAIRSDEVRNPGSGWLRRSATAAVLALLLLAMPGLTRAQRFIGSCTTANPNPNPNPESFAAVSDFNGDCRSDILWRNSSTEQVYIWLMNGTALSGSGSLGYVSSDWVIQGTGDFNGDGRADILWRNSTTGEVYIWLMNGTALSGSGSLGYVSSDWSIAGIGDFNDDGMADILWWNSTTGQVYLWLMNGTTVSGGGNVSYVSGGWTIMGIGDFNGDGDADILWRNSTSGQVYVWLMNGTTIAGTGSPGRPDSDWSILGIGDIDGNGSSDLLWRNIATGQIYIWFMSGTTIASSGSLGYVSSDWIVQGIGDYDGSGRAGILWRNSLTEQVYIWLMNGMTTGSTGSPGSPGAVWQIAVVPENPVPAVTSLSPLSESAGSPAFTLTVTWSNFTANSQVLWNGSPRATTYVSSTSLTAQVPAGEIASGGTASVTVQDPAPGGGRSDALPFTISMAANLLNIVSLEGNDLAWDASRQKLYVAVPASASTNANTITVVDPIAGTVGSATNLTSEPYGFAISDDGSELYAAVNGGATIQRFALPAVTPDIEWTLGKDSFSSTQYITGDMKVQPGAPATLAVSYGDYGVGQVALFDNGVQRGSAVTDSEMGNSLLWKQDGSELFAGWGTGCDCPYWSSTSNANLKVMSVTQSGLTAAKLYGSAFNAEGVHLHADAVTDYIYDDWGEVVNPANGLPIGSYGLSRPYDTYFPGLLSIVNPALKRYFVLQEVSVAGGGLAFEIQSFDQEQFRLLSTILIPNAVGQPTNFIPWGQSGLAFVTKGTSGGPDGQLYILDGTFVNPSGALDTTAGTVLTPVPTLTAVDPLNVTVGATNTNVTIAGRDFVGTPTVYWNGNPLPTTRSSSTAVQVSIPASDLSASATATITASNIESASAVSNALSITIDPAPPAGTQVTEYDTGGNDLVWDANAGKIYVSMPGVQGDAGDAIASVDPVAGIVTTTGFVGSDPSNLAISSDGASLYASLYSQNAIEQFTLPGLQVSQRWNLGADSYYGSSTSFSGPYFALDLEPAPGAPQTLALTLAYPGSGSPSSAAVRIYDGTTPRPNDLQSMAYSYSSLQWAGNSSMLYAIDQGEDFLVLGVGSSGATLSQRYNSILSRDSLHIHYDAGTGLIYVDDGQVVSPSSGTVVGSFGASGLVVPDSSLNEVFILGQTSAQTGTQNYTVEAFDQNTYTALGSIAIDNLIGTPSALVRWGTNGLAFTTRVGQPNDFFGSVYGGGPGRLYVISGSFVTAANRTRTGGTQQLLPVHRTWGEASLPVVAAGYSVHARP